MGDDVEIAYFGLLPAFHGRGLGGALLEYALRRGFELGVARLGPHLHARRPACAGELSRAGAWSRYRVER